MLSHVLRRSFQPAVRHARAFTGMTRPVYQSAAVTTEEPEAEAVVAADSNALDIDKSNPLYAPDSMQPWRNAGYSNLAPEGWSQWEDLPAPYKYYQVKVDPKDVEEPGMLWKLFSKWQTGIPLATLLALPAFVYDVVIIDERFELMLIFWTTVAVVNASAGDGIRKMFEGQIGEIRDALMSAEGKYTSAIEQAIDTHKKAMHVPEYLNMINNGERQLRAVETAATSRSILIDERDRMEAMLDYLVMVRESRDAEIAEGVTAAALKTVEDQLMSDKKLQQQTVDNAVAALGKSATSDDLIEKLYGDAYTAAETDAKKKLDAAKGVSADDRELFARRFGIDSTVTEEALEKAQADPAAMALLTAQCGGSTPTVGAKITQKTPIDY